MWPFPKKRDFYKMLSDQAQKVEEGMEALYEFAMDPTEDKGKKVDKIEEEADELRRILIDELNHSFVTPMDREDIFSLSRSIDDMCDYAKSTVDEMLLFQIGPNEHIKKMTEALYNSSRDVSAAVRFMKTHPQAANDHVVRAKKAENYMEHRYREALAELFKDPDIVKIIKLREIYRHLSNAADRGDESANIIGDILVKTT
jgi:predicted phosphate transport protein (TIGR00153 family)